MITRNWYKVWKPGQNLIFLLETPAPGSVPSAFNLGRIPSTLPGPGACEMAANVLGRLNSKTSFPISINRVVFPRLWNLGETKMLSALRIFNFLETDLSDSSFQLIHAVRGNLNKQTNKQTNI